ncbi:MAG: LUD domain-containing protein [Solirubrobacteraceae bacterium]|nr:LUD domain-containing protein [Patulibacter sp.]
MSAARDAVLGRIRTALGPDRPAAELPPLDATVPGLTGAALVERFAERVADYRATVVTAVDEHALRVAVDEACDRHGVARLGVAPGIEDGRVPAGVTRAPVDAATRDDVAALTELDGVLAVATLGIAETGTIVFDGGPESGPRAASLVPDVLICIVDAASIVASVPEGFARMGALVRESGRPLTLVSGPSATSDIELQRVEGVHGPRQLEVVVLAPGA